MFSCCLIHGALKDLLIPLPSQVDLPQAAEVKPVGVEEAKEVEWCRVATPLVAFIVRRRS